MEMKNKLRLIITLISFLLVSQTGFSQVLNGEINVKTPSPSIIIKNIEGFYPGEELKITLSGEVNINPKNRSKRKCSKFLGVKLKCWTVRWVDNFYHDFKSYPAELSLEYADNQNVPEDVDASYSINSKEFSIAIPNGSPENFIKKIKLNGFIPSALQTINRNTSKSFYSVQIVSNSQSRLTGLKKYLAHLKENNRVNYNAVKNAVNRRLERQFPEEVAAILLDFSGALTPSDVNQNELKRILKYASNELAPGNLNLQVKLADVYINNLEFDTAEEKLKSIVNAIRSSNSENYKDLELLGNALGTLGEVYEKRKLGLEVQDLTASAVYYERASVEFNKAVNFGLSSEMILKTINVLKKINTIASLKHASNLLEKHKLLFENLYPVKKNDKVGFIDRNGKVIIEPIYEEAFSFDQKTKITTVKFDGKWGVISKTGKKIIDFTFDDPIVFSPAMYAPYKNGEKIGYVDRTGQKKGNARFEKFVFNSSKNYNYNDIDGFFIAEKMNAKPFQYVPSSDKVYELLPSATAQRKTGVDYIMQGYSRDHKIVVRDNKFGLIDKNGKLKIGYSYDNLQVYQDKSELNQLNEKARQKKLAYDFLSYKQPLLLYKDRGEYGLMDLNENKLVKIININPYFGFDLAPMVFTVDELKKEVIAVVSDGPKKALIMRFSEGLNKQELMSAPHFIGDYYGYYGYKDFKLLAIKSANVKTQIKVHKNFSSDDWFIIPADALKFAGNRIIAARWNQPTLGKNKEALFDLNGNLLTDFIFDHLQIPQQPRMHKFGGFGGYGGYGGYGFGVVTTIPYHNGNLNYKKSNEVGVIDNNGKVLHSMNLNLQPFDFDQIPDSDLISIKTPEDKRIIDYSGITVVSLKKGEKLSYEMGSIYRITETEASSTLPYAGKVVNTRFFDIKTKRIITKFDNINVRSRIYKKNDLFGIINEKAEVIVSAKYDSLVAFDISELSSRPLYVFKRMDKYGVVDSFGKEILNNKFDQILPIIPGVPYMSINSEIKSSEILLKESIENNYLRIPDVVLEFLLNNGQEKKYTDIFYVVKNGKRGYVDSNEKVVWMED
jgi:hypothetical protein